MSIPTPELTCRELVELITEYLEGTLTEPERTRFEAHLDECPFCRTYLKHMRQTIALLGQLPEATIAPAARDELLNRFRDWRQVSRCGET